MAARPLGRRLPLRLPRRAPVDPPRYVDCRTAAASTDPGGETFAFKPDATRLEVSTTAVAPYAGLVEGIEILEAIGLRRVEERIERPTDRLKTGLVDRLCSPQTYDSGLVAFDVDHPDAFVDRAAEAGVALRGAPDGRGSGRRCTCSPPTPTWTRS